MTNLPAIDRRRLRLWDKNGHDIVCFADERLEGRQEPLDLAGRLMDGRSEAIMTIDFGSGGWRTRWSGTVYRDSQGRLKAENHMDMLRYLTWPPNPFDAGAPA